MRFAVRADASSLIGSGHVVRCLTLADALRRAGGEVRFFMRALPGDLRAVVEERGFSVTTLEVDSEMPGNMERAGADWLIVDHYHLDAVWERSMRPAVGRILVIDDLANRPHDCDAILDQNLATPATDRYAALVPATSEQLMGPRYALLRPEYAQWRARAPRRRRLGRAMIYFGSTGTTAELATSISAFDHPELEHVRVEVVCSGAQRDELAVRFESERVTLLPPQLHLAEVMARADLAIGGGGSTTWERICLRLPTIAVSMSVNEAAFLAALQKCALVRYYGSRSDLASSRLAAAIIVMSEPTVLEASSRAIEDLCDGRGAERVVSALMRDR